MANEVWGNQELVSFNAASLAYLGNSASWLNTAPLSLGGTFSQVTLANSVLNGPGAPAGNITGGVLTLASSTGIGQLMIGYGGVSSADPGPHENLYFRNKNADSNSKWASWARVIDSDNIFEYTAMLNGSGAFGNWQINASGGASYAKYLWPWEDRYDNENNPLFTDGFLNIDPTNPTSFKYTGAAISNSHQIAWGQVFLPRITGGIGQGELTLQLHYLAADNNEYSTTLDIKINGTYFGNFEGNLTGNATTATRARISRFIANSNLKPNSLAYYSDIIGTFESADNAHYLNVAATGTTSDMSASVTGTATGLLITGEGQQTPTALSPILYGNSGPQIRFNALTNTSGNYTNNYGAILFTEKSGNPAFYFLTRNQHAITISEAFIAREKLAIGAENVNNMYNFYSAGTTLFANEVTVATDTHILFIPINASSASTTQQLLLWTTDTTAVDSTLSDTNDTLSLNGLGLYKSGTRFILNIANADGINITTGSSLRLLHNGGVIPNTNNSSGSIGNNSTPVYIDSGVFAPVLYSTEITVRTGLANKVAYYRLLPKENENDPDVIEVSATSHFTNGLQLAVNSSTIDVNDTFFVNGASTFKGALKLELEDAQTSSVISFIGTQYTTPMIRFLNNNEVTASPTPASNEEAESGSEESNSEESGSEESGNDNPAEVIVRGNGMILGGGGVTVVHAGETAGTISVAAKTEILYLLSDRQIYLEAGAQEDIDDRAGICITETGSILPVIAENINSCTSSESYQSQSLGLADYRWGALYVGTANTYGNTTHPIWWNNGVPEETSFALNSSVYASAAANRLAYYSTTSTISSGDIVTNGSALSEVSYLSINNSGTDQSAYKLYVGGSSYFSGTIFNTSSINFQNNGATNGSINWGTSSGGTSIYEYVSSAQHYFIISNQSSLLAFHDGTSNTMIIDSAGQAFYPVTTNSGTLGIGSAQDVNPKRWSALFLGTSNSYGSNTQPIYWNEGVPTALTYTANRLYYSASTTSFEAGTHYISNTKLAIGSTTEPTQNLYVNGTAAFIGGLTTSGNLEPSATNTYSLGSGDATTPLRWSALFIGSDNTHGNAYTPIYWNNGVPTAASTVQKADFSFVNGATTSVVSKTGVYTANTIVITIVVTSGESNLNGPISWTSATNTITLTTTATSGAVSGYIISAQGSEI